jgi:hypothetical protein
MRPMILLFGSQILLIQDLQGFVNSKTVGFPRFEPTIELTNIGLSSLIYPIFEIPFLFFPLLGMSSKTLKEIYDYIMFFNPMFNPRKTVKKILKKMAC